MVAENMAACAATQVAFWLLLLFKEIGYQFTEPVTLVEGIKHVSITQEILATF